MNRAHHGHKPLGVVTRGTTNPNRLRRVDRYCTGPLVSALRDAPLSPVVVDLGYGAWPYTAVEWHDRLRRVRPDVRLVGVEIDPGRVAAASPWASEGRAFLLGGFEVPTPAGWGRPILLRAFNVLRQYDEDAVAAAWARLAAALAPSGRALEGTCDELGRLASWVTLDATGPTTLTLSVKLSAISKPSDVAERLPKALIHRNVPGEPVHDWLAALDRAWTLASPLAPFGVRQRWLDAVARVRADGWPFFVDRCRDSR